MKFSKKKEFPENFLWGSSTNAQQFEGAADEGGKGRSISDVRGQSEYKSHVGSEISAFDDFKVASDHYHHLEEDIKLFGEMGLKAYRFTMAWSRIFPNGDEKEPNQEGLDFYDKMITLLEEQNIKVICTLYAYDLPLGLLEKYGGWESRQCIEDYCHYVDTVTKYFKGRVQYWVPFNEQNTVDMNEFYLTGTKTHNKKDNFRLQHYMNLAWAKSTQIIHRNDKLAKTGANMADPCFYSLDCNPKNIEATDEMKYRFFGYGDVFARKEYSGFYMHQVEDIDVSDIILEGDLEEIGNAHVDFLSLTYYMSTVIENSEELKTKGFSFDGTANPFVETTEWGWNIDDYGFKHQLIEYYHRYQLPILILENGLGHRDQIEENGEINDDYRIEYLRNHIRRMKEAIDLGVEMIGYCTWSAIDLYSTHEGFDKRYGFIYVDKEKGLERRKKKSFKWYKKVIESNGTDLD